MTNPLNSDRVVLHVYWHGPTRRIENGTRTDLTAFYLLFHHSSTPFLVNLTECPASFLPKRHPVLCFTETLKNPQLQDSLYPTVKQVSCLKIEPHFQATGPNGLEKFSITIPVNLPSSIGNNKTYSLTVTASAEFFISAVLEEETIRFKKTLSTIIVPKLQLIYIKTFESAERLHQKRSLLLIEKKQDRDQLDENIRKKIHFLSLLRKTLEKVRGAIPPLILNGEQMRKDTSLLRL